VWETEQFGVRNSIVNILNLMRNVRVLISKFHLQAVIDGGQKRGLEHPKVTTLLFQIAELFFLNKPGGDGQKADVILEEVVGGVNAKALVFSSQAVRVSEQKNVVASRVRVMHKNASLKFM
jgi:hypothetical protein